jgi:hypothetical protein
MLVNLLMISSLCIPVFPWFFHIVSSHPGSWKLPSSVGYMFNRHLPNYRYKKKSLGISYGPNFAGIRLLFGRKKKFFSKSPSKPMNKKVPLLLVRLLDPHGSLHKPQFLTVGGNLIFQPIVDHCSWSNPIQPYHPPCPIKDHMCFFIAANDEWHSPISGVFSSLNPRVGGELYNLPSVPI